MSSPSVSNLPKLEEALPVVDSARQAYLDQVKILSDRIVKAQQPIRILDAINWDDSIKEHFFAHQCKQLPPVDQAYYQKRPLRFEPSPLKREFHDIEREITRTLGQLNPLANIMRRMCREYQTVIRMLEKRGTEDFADYAQELYGSSSDVFHAGDPTIAQLGEMVEETLSNLLEHESMQEDARTIEAADAVAWLNARAQDAFPNAGVRVMLDDGIASDAAAGNDYIKIRKGATFNLRDLEILEVHEGWVHLGTTLNGMSQPYCTFLSKGPPSATITQEGLAVLTEILTLRSGPRRLHKLISRVRAVTLAEQGANFCDVFNYLREHDLDAEQSYIVASRVFRGSTPTGAPFTKDITYIKGFILTYNYLRIAVAQGKLDRLPLLFLGKTVLEDMRVLADLVQEGTVVAPTFIPPYLKDCKGLATWLSFSRFIGNLNFSQLEADYGQII